MNRKNLIIGAVMLLATLAAASNVEAQTVGAHPALRGSALPVSAGIDPNTFIVGHPAGLALVLTPWLLRTLSEFTVMILTRMGTLGH